MDKIKPKIDYEGKIRNHAKDFGGFFNAHAHIDRAFTYDDKYYSHVGLSVEDIEILSLKEKQSLVWALHTGLAFTKEDLEKRMSCLLDDSIYYGITRLDTCIDVTYNSKFKSLEVAEKLKEKYKDKIDLRLGAYNVAGFKDSDPIRFELFEEAVRRCDFIVTLAEKDRKLGHVGESQHNIYMLNLGLKYKKPIHFHIGQENNPNDKGTDFLFNDLDWVYNKLHRLKKYPENVLVHNISASCYSEEDFKKYCNKLLEYNLGVICCPSAGISMKQNRNYSTPTHNSLARVWDFSLKNIPVFIGTDNINDVFVSSSTPDLYDEIFLMSNILRGYNPRILAKLGSGKSLDNFDKGRINKIIY